MVTWVFLLGLISLCSAVSPKVEKLGSEFARNHPEINREYNQVWNEIHKNSMRDDENFYEFINRITKGRMFNISMDAHTILEKEGHHIPPINHEEVPQFNCIVDHKPKRKPRNVHELTPFDVDIVAAFGDSLTAAFGANAFTPIDLFIEYHGVSWSIGGDKDVRSIITLPNILKEYNPNLVGFSNGISPPLIPIPNEHLDVAVSGSTAYGLMEQAQRFVKKMLIQPQYDFNGSWKVLTLFIGGNDLCSCCRWWKNYREKYKPKNFISEVTDVLDYLHQRVPKLFVNLVTPPNVTILQDLASPWCDFTHLLECKCGTVYGKKARKYTSQVLEEYVSNYSKLIDSGRFDTRDDFTVVLQPFFDHTIIPRHPDGSIDRSYFAPDCFHFSGKAHAASALALWNAMMEPVGNKSKTWRPRESFHCPTEEHPYFYTRKNSPNITTTKHVITTATSEQKLEPVMTVLRIEPMTLLLIIGMVAIFSYYFVCFLVRGKNQLSISESKQSTDRFFSDEIKELRIHDFSGEVNDTHQHRPCCYF